MTVSAVDNNIRHSRAVNKNMEMDELEKLFKESSFVPSGFYMVVIPVPVKEETSDGFVIPDKTQDDMLTLFTLGKVVSMGEECYDKKIVKGYQPWCKEGDYIIFHKHRGTRLEINGVQILIMSDDTPLGTVKNPEEISKDYISNMQKNN